MALSDSAIKAMKAGSRPRKVSDGEGLYLQVEPSGSKLWRCAYRWEGKQRTAAFGKYPYVTLAQARTLRTELKTKLTLGEDPSRPASAPASNTFSDVAQEWFRANRSRWVSDYASRIWARIEMDLLPHIGDRGVSAVSPQEILQALRRIEERGALELAKRVRQSCSQIFRFAIASGYCAVDPAASIGDAMKARPRAKHRTSLPPAELADFFARLRQYSGSPSTALGIKLILHTAVRSSELRSARWSEIDDQTWRIPSDRMKARRDHVVPLSSAVKSILVDLRTLTGHTEWLLPGADDSKPISYNTMIFALYRMGFHKRATIHGFRSLFSTWANESGNWRSDVIERQLAHVPSDQVRSAYNAAEYIAERRRLMTSWSEYLNRAEAKSNPHDLSDLLA